MGMLMPAKKNFGIMGAGAQERSVGVLGHVPETRAMPTLLYNAFSALISDWW
jgi:hypothetical protein